MSSARPLKLFGECYPNNVWYEQWDNGTLFKGGNLYKLWHFESKFSKGVEIITQISKSNRTHPVVQTVADGIVDLVADNFVSTHERFRFVDFSYSFSMVTTKIISFSSHEVNGKLIEDVFHADFIIPHLIILLLMFAFIHFLEPDLEISDLPFFFGNLFNQPFPKSLKMKKLASLFLLGSFDLFTLIIALIYSSLIISKMMATHQKKVINSLQELSEKQIYIISNSFVHDILDDIPILKALKDNE